MRACVLLAPGVEEIEAVTIIDVLRRGEIETEVHGVEDLRVIGSQEMTLEAYRELSAALDGQWDLVMLAGGMPGASNLRDSALVQQFRKDQEQSGAKLGVIFAAPIALAQADLLKEKKATSYPSFEKQCTSANYRL